MAVPPDFVAGQVLTAAQMNKIGLWLISSTTVGTGVASVTVSSAFSADYDNYKIIVTNVDCSVGSQDLKLTLGATATGYYGTQEYNFPTGTTGKQYMNNATSWLAGFTDVNDNASWSYDLLAPFKSKYTTILGQWQGNGYAGYLTGSLDNTTSYTAFTITPNSGTMTGGTIKVYGYRN